MSEPASIRCPRCQRVSHHPQDVAEGYCGNCHDFTTAPSDQVTPADTEAALRKQLRRAGYDEEAVERIMGGWWDLIRLGNGSLYPL